MTKFLEHFVEISAAMNRSGLWDEQDGFFYDRLVGAGGEPRSSCATSRSWGSSRPWRRSWWTGRRCGCTTWPGSASASPPSPSAAAGAATPRGPARWATCTARPDGDRLLLSVVSPEHLRRLLAEVLDEESLLSPYGLRSISRRHREHPFTVQVGDVSATVDYEPAESRSGLFGGNSNWRGPVWFPLNYLVVEALERYHRFLGDAFTVECPTGSGQMLTLQGVADELRRRLIAIFLPGPDGRRPLYGAVAALPHRPGVAEPAGVPRVLQRRRRGGPGGLPPDRLDGAGGGPDRRPGPGPGQRAGVVRAGRCRPAGKGAAGREPSRHDRGCRDVTETVQPGDQQVAGPPLWALGAALVVSGDIFAYWAVRAPSAALTVLLAVLGLVVRLLGLGLLLRWVLPFRTWWAYALAALLVVGMASAVLQALSHLG